MENLIKEGFLLKQEITEKSKRLKDINAKIAKEAEFKPGSKTGKITCPGVEVKVQLKETVKWDQDRLKEIMSHFGDFHDFFKTEYKPDTKAVNGVLKNKDSEFAKALEWCRTVKPGSPYVTYSALEVA